VIQPNFRGSDGYGEDFLKKGEGQMGLAMQDDLNDALGFAVRKVGRRQTGLPDGRFLWRLCDDVGAGAGSRSVALRHFRGGVSNLRRDVNDMRSYLNSRTYQAD
jgi:hypothetical protein